MSEFPSLADVIADHFPTEHAGGWGWCNHHHSDAGEPFEFESFEQWGQHVVTAFRDALPVGTVLREDYDGTIWTLHNRGGLFGGVDAYRECDYLPLLTSAINLPAQVIWHPSWAAK